MPYDAWQPQGGKCCHGDEGLVLLCEVGLTFSWVLKITGSYLNLAEHSQYSVIGGVAKEKSRKDVGACETGDTNQEDKVGQGHQNHPRPDVEEHRGQLRVWVGEVFWPQD